MCLTSLLLHTQAPHPIHGVFLAQHHLCLTSPVSLCIPQSTPFFSCPFSSCSPRSSSSNHLFASLSIFGSLLAFPDPFLCGSVYRTHTTKAVSSHVWPWLGFCDHITSALSLPLCPLLGLFPSPREQHYMAQCLAPVWAEL